MQSRDWLPRVGGRQEATWRASHVGELPVSPYEGVKGAGLFQAGGARTSVRGGGKWDSREAGAIGLRISKQRPGHERARTPACQKGSSIAP